MEKDIAKAEKEKLEDDERVKYVTIETGNKGVYLQVTPTDGMSKSSLETDLHEYATWVEVDNPQWPMLDKNHIKGDITVKERVTGGWNHVTYEDVMVGIHCSGFVQVNNTLYPPSMVVKIERE